MRTELQINPVPIARITINKPCVECEETEKKEAFARAAGEDQVTLSAESQEALEKEEESSEEGSAAATRPRGADGQPVTEEEARIIQQLQTTDREVRAHEQAHKAAAGPYAVGGPTYEYTTGPDGKRYATGGEVKIDTAPVPDNPEATIRKAQTIKRAALAPAEPSAQDRQVAAKATQLETRARQQIQEERREENQEKTEKTDEEGTVSETSGRNTNGAEATGQETSGVAPTGPISSENSGPTPDNPRRTLLSGGPAPESGQLLNLFT
ncbi:MAG: hypothetical protein G3M70_10895 [Candidatus Nitronauta litoralis]|uniref:SprA-related family protein n=1 Tax=Candidatus Nitronauta litoralis TaxID=2705533 RepID=A0A7T0BWV6_9BACT|nr:MAG: hypothetical protein G3M70_10895 [Candidatus Nitronauta litoralis]